MDVTNNRLAIRFGIIAGLVFTLLWFGFWAAGVPTFSKFLIFYTYIPVIFIIILVGAFQRRKQLGGYMTFREALVFAFLAYVIYELFYALGTIILFKMLDPQLADKVLVYLIDWTRRFMEGMGMSDSDVDDAVKKIQDTGSSEYSYGQIILGLGTSLIWDFIKSLIIALISRRNKPEFESFIQAKT